MKLTIDASVAVKWFIDEPRHELARDVLVQGFELTAPDLILVEVANALRNKVRNGLADKADMVKVLAMLPAMFESLADTRATLAEAFELACLINHPVADCVYLSCAKMTGTALLTDDAMLRARTQVLASDVKVISLTEWTAKSPGRPA
jgi:predicted nucleic acid-binding protein